MSYTIFSNLHIKPWLSACALSVLLGFSVTSCNDFIAAQCKLHPEFIGFGTMHQDFEDKETEINRIIEMGLHGVKLHPDTQEVNMDDPRLMELRPPPRR